MVDKRDKWVYVAILVALLVGVFLSMIILCKTVDAWWNTSWNYSQGGNISSDVACGNLVDYEVRFDLDYGVGASTGNLTYTNGHSRTDFADVRFVLNGTVLPHWFEQVNGGTTAIVWVNFSMIPVAGQNFSIYYGNPLAPDISEGNTTWNFFDDFLGSALLPHWNIACGAPNVVVAGSWITITNTGAAIDTVRNPACNQSDYKYISNVSITNGAVYWGMNEPKRCGVNQNGASYNKNPAGAERVRRWINGVGTTWVHAYPASPWTSRIYGNGTWVRWFYNDVKMETQQYAGVGISPFLGSGTNTVVLAMDWVAVGDLCRPEPPLGIWSSENVVPTLGPPTNFTITELGGDAVNLNWTIGLNSENTLIRMMTSGYPSSRTEGQLIYFGAGNGVKDNGLSLDTTTYYYRAWSNRVLEYDGYASAQIGGNMIQFGVIAFIALGISALAFWQKKLWVFLLAGMAWIGFWGYCWTSYDYGSVMWYFGILGIAAGLVLFVAPAWFTKEKEPYQRKELDAEYQKEVRERKKQARARLRGDES